MESKIVPFEDEFGDKFLVTHTGLSVSVEAESLREAYIVQQGLEAYYLYLMGTHSFVSKLDGKQIENSKRRIESLKDRMGTDPQIKPYGE